MPVEDVFSISGRGTVVTGRVERGIVKVVKRSRSLVSRTRRRRRVRVLRCSASCLTKVVRARTLGVLLRGTKRDDVERGQVLAIPGR